MSKTPAQLDSEIAVARMIGRHVKSGWHGLADGVIVQWEPFGAGMTDVLVHDASTGRDAWYASHGLSPIDGKGPLPSRADVKKLRQREMEGALETIRAQHIKEWRRPWPGAEHGKAIVGRSIDAALADVRGRKHSTIRAPKPDLSVRQINAIVRAADGRNIYLIRERMGEPSVQSVQRVIRARTKGRETEVRSLATGNWIPVLPERGDRLEVR